MTVVFMVGRRVPKSWFKRMSNNVSNVISFQEHLWIMIKQALQLAKRKANASNTLTFVLSYDDESEDIHYNIEWMKVVIQGTEEQEQDEYKDCMNIYKPLGNIISKKELPKDENLARHFKSNILTNMKVEEAYKQGFGEMESNNIANKLLEMGILTHIEWIKDFEIRKNDITPDF